MLDIEQFKDRASQLFNNCRARWRNQLEKGLPDGVRLNIPPDQVLPYTRAEFYRWLFARMGLQVTLCPYCRAAMDVLSMHLDHRTPLIRGGGPELDNLEPTCDRCNKVKGEFTHEEFGALVAFMEAHPWLRARLEGALINAALGKLARFPCTKSPRKKRTTVQDRLAFRPLTH